VSSETDRLLSEFIDAWNVGARPDAAAYVERAMPQEREALADEIGAWLAWAPDAPLDGATRAAIRAEPAVREVLTGALVRAGLWPALLPRLRRRARLSVGEVATRLTAALGVTGAEDKAAAYLGSLEEGRLDPGGVSERVLDALARILGVGADDLDAAGAPGAWRPAAAASWRAEPEAVEAAHVDLDLLADALTTPSSEPWDAVDELFRGGRQ
jgi:hypothetical protein